MADLLGATNPVPGYDGASQNRSHSALPQVQDPRVQNVPDLSRVSRADGRTEQQGAGNHLDAGRLRYDSNLQTFLQQLRDAPDLAAVLAKTVVWMRGLVSAPGLSEGIAQEMAQLLEMLRMDQEGFQRFFLNQMQAGNRFSGPLFSLLRQAYQNMPSEGMREAILNFAKRYGDFSAEQHLAENMTLRLKQMADYLPKSWRGQLMELTARLENGLQAGSRTGNLKLLQGEIIPAVLINIAPNGIAEVGCSFVCGTENRRKIGLASEKNDKDFHQILTDCFIAGRAGFDFTEHYF